MKDIKGIIFDVDGVLLDTERLSCRCWIETMAKYDLEMTEDIFKKIMGRNFDGIIEYLKGVFKDPNIDFNQISLEKRKLMVEILDSGEIPVLPGVHELLDYLKESGYKLGIATSTGKDRAKARLIKAKILDYMEADMYGSEVDNSKPHPEIFLKAAEKLNLDPKECIVLEDSPAGLKAARDGGFTVINVVDYKEPDEEMSKNTDYVFENLYQVKKWFEENR